MSDVLREDRLGAEADALYAELVATHDGLSDEASAALNARLVLLLMNAVGDAAVLRRALGIAREGFAKDAAPADTRIGGAPRAD